jgi:hypothetical protein
MRKKWEQKITVRQERKNSRKSGSYLRYFGKYTLEDKLYTRLSIAQVSREVAN